MAAPLTVSLLAIPEASISTLHGLYDVLNAFALLKGHDESIPNEPPFQVDIVGLQPGPLVLACGLSTPVQRSVSEIDRPDIVIVPSVVLHSTGWQRGRYPELEVWLRSAHERGAILCSACSGVFLLAETGLLQGQPVTLHWSYRSTFERLYPDLEVHPDRPLIVAGNRQQFVTSGASMSWHDLVLYLIARYVGRTPAQTMANFFALQWHHDGLGPYIVFSPRADHGDAAVAEAQRWLTKHYAVADPVSAVVRQSGLAERTFMRRFQCATRFSPLSYVQRLRVEDAKRRLERTDQSIEEIGWRVGYEDPSFFRRLFKRITGVTPGHYRKQFGIPPSSNGKVEPR